MNRQTTLSHFLKTLFYIFVQKEKNVGLQTNYQKCPSNGSFLKQNECVKSLNAEMCDILMGICSRTQAHLSICLSVAHTPSTLWWMLIFLPLSVQQQLSGTSEHHWSQIFTAEERWFRPQLAAKYQYITGNEGGWNEWRCSLFSFENKWLHQMIHHHPPPLKFSTWARKDLLQSNSIKYSLCCKSVSFSWGNSYLGTLVSPATHLQPCVTSVKFVNWTF